MKLPIIASAIVGAISAGLTPGHLQTDAAASHQAISPLIAGDYLIAAPGRIEPASEEIRIGTSVTAVLKEVLVKEGQQVKRDDVLARLQSDDLAADVAKADAELRLAQAQLQRAINGALPAERAETLAGVAETEAIEKNAASDFERQRTLGSQNVASKSAVEQAERAYAVARERHKAALDKYALVNDPTRKEDIDVAKARVDVARAVRDEAQAELDKTVIRSPIDGVVLRTYRHPGELISIYIDEPILSIGDLSRLYVRADVDEADIAKVEPGLPAYVTADAYGDQQFTGHIVRVGQELGKKNILTDDPKEKTDTRVLEVLIELDSLNPLRPGLRVNTFIMRPGVAGRSQLSG
jgi:ABC exporter DevB family membrane fusion protein